MSCACMSFHGDQHILYIMANTCTHHGLDSLNTEASRAYRIFNEF